MWSCSLSRVDKDQVRFDKRVVLAGCTNCLYCKMCRAVIIQFDMPSTFLYFIVCCNLSRIRSKGLKHFQLTCQWLLSTLSWLHLQGLGPLGSNLCKKPWRQHAWYCCFLCCANNNLSGEHWYRPPINWQCPKSMDYRITWQIISLGILIVCDVSGNRKRNGQSWNDRTFFR